MTAKWGKLRGPISREAAESEPEDQRLFNRPPHRPTAQVKTIDAKRVRAELERQQT